MRSFELLYGEGKTVDLCLSAFSYEEHGKKVITLNANNEPIISKVETYYKYLGRDLSDTIGDELLLEKAIRYNEKGFSAIFVDNAHLLSVNDVEQLFLISLIYNIRVVCYTNRVDTEGAIRCWELANIIKRVDASNGRNSDDVTFIYGAMDSCKTSSLLIKADVLERRKGKQIITIKPKLDRTEEYIKSRVGIKRKADLVIDNTKPLTIPNLKGLDTILVDEAQFLSPDIIESLTEKCKTNGIHIIFYGLKSDFRTQSFPGSKKLFLLSDQLIKLDTVCGCTNFVEFNARTVNDRYVYEGDQFVVDNGGEIAYHSLCANCYVRDVWRLPINDHKALVKRYM
ncbi:MAG: hypothetical protein PHD02_00670 [Bacilli bacterium]|nr:hypothetical protein [Bacilli bacterium]